MMTSHENDDVISFLMMSEQFWPSKKIHFVLGYYWRKFQLNCSNNLEMPEGGHYVPPPPGSGSPKKPRFNRVNIIHGNLKKRIDSFWDKAKLKNRKICINLNIVNQLETETVVDNVIRIRILSRLPTIQISKFIKTWGNHSDIQNCIRRP